MGLRRCSVLSLIVLLVVVLFLAKVLFIAYGVYVLVNAVLSAIWTHGLVSFKDIFIGVLLLILGTININVGEKDTCAYKLEK